MLYNIVMINTSPNWEELFDKVEHCSLCGETPTMCDCAKHNSTDFDDMDDYDDY